MAARRKATDPVPLGPALNWSDADLDELSRIDDGDVSEAQAWAEENSPQLARLLEAKPNRRQEMPAVDPPPTL